MVPDEPQNVVPGIAAYSQAVEYLYGHPLPLPVVPEGTHPASYLAGGGRLADVMEQSRPGETPVRTGRKKPYREKSVDEGIAFRMVVGRLRDLFQTVDFGKEAPQALIASKTLLPLCGVGMGQSRFDVIQVTHSSILSPAG